MVLSQEAQAYQPGQVAIQVLGELSVLRDGQPVVLPQSKKTRCLLAYLAVVGRPQRRERLCELFWEIPDDPRGALRWSLSKIRQIVGEALEANRETVYLHKDRIALDRDGLKPGQTRDLDQLETGELERMAALFRGRFLDDLAMPNCPEFEAWRVSHATEAELLLLRLRRVLIDRLREEPERALPHAHALLALNPSDGTVAAEVEALTKASRQRTFAPEQHGSFRESVAIGSTSTDKRKPQEIRYCTTRGGVRIAYSITGDGPPIVKTANWMSHLEYEWESPIWRHWIEGLSTQNRLVRYDERGNGLSDWRVEDISFDIMLADLEDVVEAAGLDRFALLGISQGAAISAAYAVRHPERVSHLVLYGGFVKGWRAGGDPEQIARWSAMGTLIRQGWGQNNPAFRQVFTSLFVPGATQQQMDWFNELQRKTVSPENAERLHEAFGDFDVLALLPRVTTPTLVLHAREDAVAPIKSGRAFAKGIPGARFVSLESKNHILLAHEPAFAQLLGEVNRFLATQ